MEKYASKNIGRHDFQIDLGIALLNHGIGLDWDGDKRPDCIRVGELVPCNCKKCYFCINGYTSDIAHKKRARVTVEYKCNTRMKTEKCTDHRVNIATSGAYCKMCYRKQDKSLNAVDKKKKCKMSRLDCVVCKEAVCGICWKSGYDKHRK